LTVDEQLKAKLVDFLDGMGRRLNGGSDFVSTETPELVREWVRWEAVSGFTYAALCLTALIGLAVVMRRLWRNWLACDTRYHEPPLVGGMMTTFMFAIGVAVFGFISADRGMKAVVAPRVVAVEKVADIVKTVRR